MNSRDNIPALRDMKLDKAFIAHTFEHLSNRMSWRSELPIGAKGFYTNFGGP